MCSQKIISPTADHRHPRLAEVALRAVGAIEVASQNCSLTESELAQAVIDALHGQDHGDHADVILGALPGASLAGWNRDPVVSSDTSLKALLQSDWCCKDYLEALCVAIVRLEACHHVSLVRKFVFRFVHKSDPDILNRSSEELYAYGYIGLSNALRGYDPSSNNTISTFAALRIDGAIRDGIRAESPVPKRLTTFVRAVESAEEKLTLALSRIPTKSELCAELGDQARYLHLYPRLRLQASIDELESFNPQSPEDVSHSVEIMSLREDLQEGLALLTEFERDSLLLVHCDGLTVRAAARELGATQREVRKAADCAISKLRTMPTIEQWKPASVS